MVINIHPKPKRITTELSKKKLARSQLRRIIFIPEAGDESAFSEAHDFKEARWTPAWNYGGKVGRPGGKQTLESVVKEEPQKTVKIEKQ